jgi:hypothetical protein
MIHLHDDLVFWKNSIFWAAVLMVAPYIIKYTWSIIISPAEQNVMVELILDLISLCGASGVVIGVTKISHQIH